MVNVSVIGATGYAGAELMRILSGHGNVNITHAVSKNFAGKQLGDVYPNFKSKDMLLENMDAERIGADSDVVFFSLPHGASGEFIPHFLKRGIRVIDLSGDFRYRDAAVYERWYNIPHNAKELLGKSAYGLPEVYREKIRGAKLVGNPGCYPTGAVLALYPLLKAGVIGTDGIIIDSKSGVSGAGRVEKLENLYCEVDESVKAYGVASHRHTSEIEQELSIASGRDITVSFTPHLVPLKRGILSTIYAPLKNGASEKDIFDAYGIYKDEPFVSVSGALPEIKHVAGSNRCAIGFVCDARTGRLVIVSCIDNLIKGAAGQAVQNMNIMCSLRETEGLEGLGWYL